MKKFLLAIIASLSLSLLPLVPVSAFPFDDTVLEDMGLNVENVITDNYAQATDENSLFVVVAQVIQVFLGLLGTIFIFLMVYSGYTWMTASGDEKKVEKAQQTIKVAIIGLLIIVAAYIITYFIFMALPTGGTQLPQSN